jgi:tetratricopeptide (TPR) repeat protein
VTAQLATLIQNAVGPDFRIEQELDGGGMSRLFLATDVRHDRRVVVKVLSPELVSEQSTARFKREIELTVRLQHPHILPILTSGAWEDALYYITPFIPGESLRERIARDGKLPLDDVIRILREVSGALAFAHQRGIVHRDVKPGNILLAEGHAILADFGIARAVGTTATPLTGSGMVPGTPAYMAPELPTDEKADVYSLGVVAYEMLCGALPKRGATAKEIIAARGKVAGDHMSTLKSLAETIADAISSAPDRRVQTAPELEGRLDPGVLAPRRTSLRILFLSGAIVAAGLVGVWLYGHVGTLEADRYIVLASGTDSLSAVDAVQRAVSEWRGIAVVDEAEAAAAAKRAAGGLTRSEAHAIAKRLHARNLITVESSRDADSVALRATLYDVAGDSMVRAKRVAYWRAAAGAERTLALRRLANALLRSGDELPWSGAADDSAPSLPAWRAFDDGRRLIVSWKLNDAESKFRQAIDLQPRIAPAQLWLAQTIVWLNASDRMAAARSAALRSLELPGLLSTHDSLHARGVLALVSGDYPSACRTFDALVARDSISLVAWIGKGDCRAQDRAVIADPRSPTGHSFRGSYESAARAYQRAAELGPSMQSPDFQGWMLGKLSRVLTSATNVIRAGSGADSTNYGSQPLLDHDTLAFHPVTLAQLSDPAVNPKPQEVQAAVDRNRVLLRRAAEEWVRRAPNDPVAFDSLATRLELSGGLATIAEQQLTTLQVVDRALSLAKDSLERAHLGVMRVRLLVKDSQFDKARAAADSLLKSGVGRLPRYIDGVAGLAVLLGRVDEAAHLLARDPYNAKVFGGRGGVVIMPPQLADVSASLVARSVFGLGGDSTLELAQKFDALVASYFPGADAAADVRRSVTPRALAFVYPTGSSYLAQLPDAHLGAVDWFQSLARGDGATVRRAVAARGQAGVQSNPGNSVDMMFLRARAAMLVFDTTSAVHELDPVLQAMPTIAPTLLWQVDQIGSLIRALALRAEIASARRDKHTAEQCAGAVVSLWRNADAPLQPVVQRMKALAGAG